MDAVARQPAHSIVARIERSEIRDRDCSWGGPPFPVPPLNAGYIGACGEAEQGGAYPSPQSGAIAATA